MSEHLNIKPYSHSLQPKKEAWLKEAWSKVNVERFTKELAPLITAGPPGVTGFAEGRPRVREIIAYWPTLINKDLIKTKAYI